MKRTRRLLAVAAAAILATGGGVAGEKELKCVADSPEAIGRARTGSEADASAWQWLAPKKLLEPTERNIHTFKNGTTRGVPFTRAGLEAAGMSSLLGVPDPSGLIQYLRGDRSAEGSTYRRRSSPLGDFVGAQPLLVKDLVDAGYDFLLGSTPGRSNYLRFLNAKKYRPAHLFVAADDGMLHAFNADDGAESFAFLPRSVLRRAKQLADPLYSRRYLVNGPLAEVDVYDKASAKWRNLVVGGGGGVSKNLFALNVPVTAVPDTGEPTMLTAPQSAPGAGDILWEISADDKDFLELGHVLRPPEAGILRDGSWVIVVGNGYESASGRAQLFVLDAISGARLAVLDTGMGSSSAPNGLGGVKLVRDAAKRIVAAYAGDLYGNLWKFDLSSAAPSGWGIAFEGKPLFKAVNGVGEAEPITAAPSYMRHPLGGVMVFAGSGKLFESGDIKVQSERSLYGVWDQVAIGAGSGDAENRIKDHASLVIQIPSPLPTGGASGDYLALSNKAVDYGTGSHARKRGWKIPLTIEMGQRLIHDPHVAGARVIFDTWAPGDVAAGCPGPPHVLSFAVDPFTGGPARGVPTFDTNRNGYIDVADDPTAAVMRFLNSGSPRSVHSSGSRTRPGSRQHDRTEDSKIVSLGKGPIGRQWRQIVAPPPYRSTP
jgi:type IV pilus assembly protein PilY1